MMYACSLGIEQTIHQFVGHSPSVANLPRCAGAKRSIARNCSTIRECGSLQVPVGPPERIRTQPAVLRLRAFGAAEKVG